MIRIRRSVARRSAPRLGARARAALMVTGLLLSGVAPTALVVVPAAAQDAAQQSPSDGGAPASGAPDGGAQPAPGHDVHTTLRRWVDSSGAVHYGDSTSAPAQAANVTVTTTAPTPPASSDAPKPPADPQASWPKDANGNRVPPTASDACEVAKKNSAALADAVRPAVSTDPKTGYSHVLSPAERAQAQTQANQDIAAFCPGGEAGSSSDGQ